jgi:DNA-binding NtrC family response regulator
LLADGYQVEEADTCRSARDRFRVSRPEAVIASARLVDGGALELLAHVRGIEPHTSFIVLAEYAALDVAVAALQEGAEQFLMKPVDRPALLLILQRALENQRHRRRSLREESLQTREPLDPFLGTSPAIHTLHEQTRKVLFAERPVLMLGETGAGKGVLAAWLHRNGPRREEGFVDINCAGLSRELLETELFGHEKGAFTGAVATKVGLLEIADRGTLFLDEIGDVDLQVQPKLLKVLEEGRFRRLGDVQDRQADVWMIAATHQNLASLVEEKRFRSDLYFRVSTLLLRLPPLRERTEDIPVLAEYFLRRIASELGRGIPILSPAAVVRLAKHSWPGNIRELRNVLERAALQSEKSLIDAGDLGFDFDRRTDEDAALPSMTLAEAERWLIDQTLREEGGHVEPAARRLGISRSSLYQRIQKHRIPVSRI